MKRRDLLQLGLLFLLAFGLRFHDLGRPPTRWMDEANNIEGAIHYWEAGQFEPDTWQHPPLRNLSAYAFLTVLGDNPHGWRMRNVLLGAAAAVLAWLLGHHIGGWRVGLLAGLLVATDPLHVVLSRFTFEEIYGGTFFLAAVVLFAGWRDRTLGLLASALLVGCALATKWYYAPAWLLMLGLLLREAAPLRTPAAGAFVLAAWTLLPATVYLASFGPWFGRGYALADFPEFTLNAYHHLQAMTSHYVNVVDQREVFQAHTSALEWFVRAIWIGEGMRLDPGTGVFLMYVNDLPVWGLTLPAVALTALLAWRRRRLSWALPSLFFAALYASFLPVERAVFIYSAAPLLPFAFAAIALATVWISDRFAPTAYWIALALVACWNLYLYPLVAAKPVPVALYRWLLDGAEVILH